MHYDYGNIDPHNVADAIPTHPMAHEVKNRLVPTYTDTAVCYSTIEGFVSLRNTETGSWFGDALCRTLIEHAADEELNTLFTLINEKVMEREGHERVKQSVEVQYRGWKKQLYFNPGIYRA
jgi:hypothetical protein